MSYVFDEGVDKYLDVLVGIEGFLAQEISRDEPNQIFIDQAISLRNIIIQRTDEKDYFFTKDKELLNSQLSQLQKEELKSDDMDTDLYNAISNFRKTLCEYRPKK